MIQGMMPDNGDLMSELGSQEWYLGLFFFVFIFLGALTIMNMLIGILCEVVDSVAEEENEAMELEKVSAEIRSVLEDVDQNFDGVVSRDEVRGMMKTAEVVKTLQSAGVDVFGLVDQADAVFEAVGRETLEFDEFIDVIWTCRATNASILRAIAEARRLLSRRISSVEMSLVHVQRKLDGDFSRQSSPRGSPSMEDVQPVHVPKNPMPPPVQDMPQVYGQAPDPYLRLHQSADPYQDFQQSPPLTHRSSYGAGSTPRMGVATPRSGAPHNGPGAATPRSGAWQAQAVRLDVSPSVWRPDPGIAV